LKRFILPVAITIIYLYGCSETKFPSYLKKPDTHPHFGGPNYLKAVAMAETQENAELRAKEAIAAQIRSSLESMRAIYNIEIESQNQTGPCVTRRIQEEYYENIKVEVSFSHAELIRIDQGSSGFYRNTYYAFAYLDKDELLRELKPDYEQLRRRFVVTSNLAMNDIRAGRVQEFTGNYRNSTDLYGKLEEKAHEISVILEKVYSPHLDSREAFLELIERRLDYMDRLSFTLIFNGPSSDIGKKKIKSIFQKFFKDAGLTTSLCDSCPCRGMEDYRFIINAREDCYAGHLGPVCSLHLDAYVEICMNLHRVCLINFPDRMKGAHTRNYSLALKDLYRKLPERMMWDAFLLQMKQFFPI
jgi:hypothetical protein